MKLQKYILASIILLFIFLSGLILHNFHSVNSYFNTNTYISNSQSQQSSSNNEIIDSVFNYKVFEYYDHDYFNQICESSLPATYYALYILEALGKLDQINQTEILHYIMSQYEVGSNRFMDALAYRYLDTDFSQFYYPLSTILEVNCYAILSLELLDSLHLIDSQRMIDFIWSCYNPISSGFIGQPYNAGLDDGFKISTMDNTYFAVSALDLLMNDWLGYSTQRDGIIQLVNDLQLPAGGFLNDQDAGIDTLNPFFDPNLLASYYCVKTLEVFGMEGSIRISDFHQFLDSLYDSNYNYFQISQWDYSVNYTNIVATALGLELSDIINYVSIDRNDLLAFILVNRNSLGNWDQSTTVNHHELIDTFQIIRSLQNSQEISQLSLDDKNQIGNATFYYYHHKGFSPISEEYTSMSLIHDIVSSFDLFDRTSELDIQKIYSEIKDSYIQTFTQPFANSFAGYLIKSSDFVGLRSHPIEYYTTGTKNHINKISQLYSHKSTFLALESLKTLFKLDDFALEFDLMDLVNDIIATQFLNDTYYENYGAFTPLWFYEVNRSEYLSKKIFFEYSYYGIKCLELLTEQLKLGSVTGLGFDTTALYTYVDRNIIETPTTLFFDPSYTNDAETILKNTFYMIYILQALNSYNKDNQKIKNFVLSNLDYTNIKNIYYCYKISEILNLDIVFNVNLIQELVQTIYSEEYHEFFLTSNREVLCQEVFLWICEMARNSDIGIEAHYSSIVPLGGFNRIYASLHNLIISDFGTYITFKFESNHIGTYVFDKLENRTYIVDIPIPLDSESYPEIEGILCAYEGPQRKAEYTILFSTTYNLNYNISIGKSMDAVSFIVNASINSNGKDYSLEDGRVYVHISNNGKI
ncbi:MAG: hypothetical protein ACFFDN_30735, partial [Candidatus Hodarchaeota archaeon]